MKSSSPGSRHKSALSTIVAVGLAVALLAVGLVGGYFLGGRQAAVRTATVPGPISPIIQSGGETTVTVTTTATVTQPTTATQPTAVTEGDEARAPYLTKYAVQDATERKAVCNDGSPAVFYFRPGRSEYRDKWVIWFEGGGACYDLGTCNQRWNEQEFLMT